MFSDSRSGGRRGRRRGREVVFPRPDPPPPLCIFLTTEEVSVS